MEQGWGQAGWTGEGRLWVVEDRMTRHSCLFLSLTAELSQTGEELLPPALLSPLLTISLTSSPTFCLPDKGRDFLALLLPLLSLYLTGQ